MAGGDSCPLRRTYCFKILFFFFQAEDGIRDLIVTGVQTCALPIFIAFPPSAVSEPLRAIRSVERSTYDVLANIFTQTIAAQKRNGVLGQPMCTARSEERRVGKECRSRWSPYH